MVKRRHDVYDCTYDLIVAMIMEAEQLSKEEEYVSVVANTDITLEIIREVFIDFDAIISNLYYDPFECDEYIASFYIGSNGQLEVSVDCAYMTGCDKYLAPPNGIIYVHEDVTEEFINDVVENKYTHYGNIIRFGIEEFDGYDDEDDCDNCPDRDCCELYHGCDCDECEEEDEDDVTTTGEHVTVSRDKNTGKVKGFTKSYFGTNDKGVQYSHSHSYYSDSWEDVINAAKALGIDL